MILYDEVIHNAMHGWEREHLPLSEEGKFLQLRQVVVFLRRPYWTKCTCVCTFHILVAHRCGIMSQNRIRYRCTYLRSVCHLILEQLSLQIYVQYYRFKYKTKCSECNSINQYISQLEANKRSWPVIDWKRSGRSTKVMILYRDFNQMACKQLAFVCTSEKQSLEELSPQCKEKSDSWNTLQYPYMSSILQALISFSNPSRASILHWVLQSPLWLSKTYLIWVSFNLYALREQGLVMTKMECPGPVASIR